MCLVEENMNIRGRTNTLDLGMVTIKCCGRSVVSRCLGEEIWRRKEKPFYISGDGGNAMDFSGKRKTC